VRTGPSARDRCQITRAVPRSHGARSDAAGTLDVGGAARRDNRASGVMGSRRWASGGGGERGGQGWRAGGA
jgi:hypothetical protein